jgi:hypothetical protein
MNEFVVRGFFMACGMAIFCGLMGLTMLVVAQIIKLIADFDYAMHGIKKEKKGC